MKTSVMSVVGQRVPLTFVKDIGKNEPANGFHAEIYETVSVPHSYAVVYFNGGKETGGVYFLHSLEDAVADAVRMYTIAAEDIPHE